MVASGKPSVFVATKEPSLPKTSDNFNDSRLGLQWQWCHNPANDYWSLTERKGWLTIHALPSPDLKNARNMLTQKTMGYQGQATTVMDCRSIAQGTFAGLLCVGRQYRGIGVSADGIYLENDGQRQVVSSRKPSKVWLRLSLDLHTSHSFQFYYSLDGKHFTAAGTPFHMHSGNWKGVRLGLYCYGQQGKAQFDTFHYDILK